MINVINRREYMREYLHKNRERINERARKKYAENIEKRHEEYIKKREEKLRYQHEYYIKKREIILVKSKARRCGISDFRELMNETV